MFSRLNDLKSYIRSDIAEILTNLEIESIDRFDIEKHKNEVKEYFDSNHYEEPTTTTWHEAWEVVAGNEYSKYSKPLTFEGCESSIDCVVYEANELVREAYQDLFDDILNEMLFDMID